MAFCQQEKKSYSLWYIRNGIKLSYLSPSSSSFVTNYLCKNTLYQIIWRERIWNLVNLKTAYTQSFYKIPSVLAFIFLFLYFSQVYFIHSEMLCVNRLMSFDKWIYHTSYSYQYIKYWHHPSKFLKAPSLSASMPTRKYYCDLFHYRFVFHVLDVHIQCILMCFVCFFPSAQCFWDSFMLLHVSI